MNSGAWRRNPLKSRGCVPLACPVPERYAALRDEGTCIKHTNMRCHLNLPSYAENHGLQDVDEYVEGTLRSSYERRGVCFGGFHPAKHVEEPRLRALTHFGVQARAHLNLIARFKERRT